MTVQIILLALSAAVMHAVWNAMVKSSTDRLTALGMINAGHVLFGAVVACFVPLPSVESWKFILGSTCVHITYNSMLFVSYRLGDLSLVYPIARGISPIMVTLGAQWAVGETLPTGVWIGVLVISGAIFLLAAPAIFNKASKGAVIAALFTGCCIASYSLIDGLGGRISGHAIAYFAWLMILSFPFAIFALVKRRHALRDLTQKQLGTMLLGGILSSFAYGLIIYAKSLAPMGAVSALRETSVVFAALIGIFLFGEGPRTIRLIAAVFVAGGIILISVA